MAGGTTIGATAVTKTAIAAVIDNATKATAALIVGVFMTRLALLLVQPIVHLFMKAIASMANTHILSHHFVPPSTLNRVLQRPNPSSVLPKVFQRALPHSAMFLHLRPMNLRLLRLLPSLPSLTHRESSPITSHLL
ncbi:hypothetical protein DYB28_008765 [Aphanomyces astaci]|uniref:Uncharacterized protein n=1 Tax=Aphanomyces astaci TaxID=112090 RepID=A0A9X8E7Y2_APHAT|nr:hypothetical protein DYB28_008768 [Aphanomyces astaci]RLO12468.1 hypothetical protein DYB28_008765 [Aphanomyces astaci]